MVGTSKKVLANESDSTFLGGYKLEQCHLLTGKQDGCV
jgi:hypothetical protein